jgi:hypothetical protein
MKVAILLRSIWDDDQCDFLAERMVAGGCKISHVTDFVKGEVLEASFEPADYITVTIKLPITTEVSNRCDIRFESAVEISERL